jgi:hypothetical protein
MISTTSRWEGCRFGRSTAERRIVADTHRACTEQYWPRFHRAGGTFSRAAIFSMSSSDSRPAPATISGLGFAADLPSANRRIFTAKRPVNGL